MLKRTFNSAVYFIVLLTVPYCVQAQDNLITPANKKLQMKFLKPYKSSFDVIVQNNGKKKDYGLLIDEVKIIEMNGEKYFERIQKMPDINLVDTSINNFNDLSPVSHAGNNLSGYLHLNFGKSKVTGEKYLSKNDSLIKINTKMPTPYFDSNMFEVVLRLLPLDNNFKGAVPYYQFETGGYTIYSVKVIGSEELKNPDGTTENSWILETSYNDSRSDIYISKKTREVLKKMVIRSPQVKILFERVD